MLLIRRNFHFNQNVNSFSGQTLKACTLNSQMFVKWTDEFLKNEFLSVWFGEKQFVS